jgi:hypothetical protein
MMIFPLSISDISQWLGATALVLLTSELIISLPEYSSRILIDKTRLRIATIGCGLAFLATVLLLVA